MSEYKRAIQEEVTYNDNSIVSKRLLSNGNGNVTIFSFDKHETLSPHKAPFDALVLILEGKALIMIEEEEHIISKDEYIILPANKIHSVKAVERFKMLLTMIKDKE